MAIESSFVLAHCLSQERDLDGALRRYETERMPRTAWITDQSWKIGRIGQLENPLACKARERAEDSAGHDDEKNIGEGGEL